MREAAARTPQSYEAALADLRNACPALAVELGRAHSNRGSRLSQLGDGVFLRGLDELLVHLGRVGEALRSDRRTLPVGDLIGRARNHYAVGIEAMLGGMHHVVYDSMRAVMEIQFLLRDFSLFPTHLLEWATDAAARKKKFKPVQLRERAAAAAGKKPSDMAEDADYRGHSQWLHVNPIAHPLAGEQGISEDRMPIMACFNELYEHGRRLVFAIDVAGHALAVDVPLPSPDDLASFRAGWERANEMEQMFRALIEASCQPSAEGGKTS